MSALTSYDYHRSALSSPGPESEHKLSPVGKWAKELIDAMCGFSLRPWQKRRYLLADPTRGFEQRRRVSVAAAAAAARARPAVGDKRR